MVPLAFRGLLYPLKTAKKRKYYNLPLFFFYFFSIFSVQTYLSPPETAPKNHRYLTLL